MDSLIKPVDLLLDVRGIDKSLLQATFPQIGNIAVINWIYFSIGQIHCLDDQPYFQYEPPKILHPNQFYELAALLPVISRQEIIEYFSNTN